METRVGSSHLLPSSDDAPEISDDSPTSFPKFFTDEQITIARNTAKEVGPRVYELIGFNSDEVTIFVFGCQGDPGRGQHVVAKLMSDAALRKKPALLIGLGDYTYPNAMNSPNDPRFTTHFYELYANKKSYPGIADIPMIGALGNHDGNHYKGFTSFVYGGGKLAKALRYESGDQAELNFLANAYLVRTYDPVSSITRKELYTSKILRISQLPKCDIPFFFNSRIIGNKQFFFINSNSLARDFLSSLDDKDPNNQIHWLVREYRVARFAKKDIIFVQHQPLNAIDKRSRESGGDADLYFPTEESAESLQRLAQVLSFTTVTKNYSKIIKRIYERLGLVPDLLLCAHHHALSSFNNKQDARDTYQFCQITSGAAGGKLQERESFTRYDDISYLEGYGFVELSFNKNNHKPIRYALVSETARLEFKTKSKKPIVHSRFNPTENTGFDDNLAEKLRAIILSACDDYQLNLENNQDPENDSEYGRLFGRKRFHLPAEVPHLHNIMAYLQKPDPDKLEILLIRMCSMMSALPSRDDPNGLYITINNKLRQFPFIKLSLQELRDEYSAAPESRT